jgi:hypothetical protein
VPILRSLRYARSWYRDPRKFGSDVGSLVRSPQSFLTATSDLSHVLSTAVTAVTDSTFKTKANGLATDVANIRTAIQGRTCAKLWRRHGRGGECAGADHQLQRPRRDSHRGTLKLDGGLDSNV